MRSILFSAFLACGAVACASSPPATAPTEARQATETLAPIKVLSSEAVRADIALLRRALETIHPGLVRYTSRGELNQAFAELEQAAGQPMTDSELYRRISKILAMVRCSHTKAEQPPALEAWRMESPSHLPFRFKILQGRMIVVSSDPQQANLPRGSEILAINGRQVSDLIAELIQYVPSDGATDASRLAYLASDGDLMGADFDHFYPHLYGFPNGFSLSVKDDDSAPLRTVELKPISFRDWTSLENNGAAYRQDFSTSTTWRMLSDDAGYVRIGTFVNYRDPVDAAALFGQVITELQAAGMQRLIVDLRDNGGGSNDASLALIDAVTKVPYVYQRAVRYRAIRYGNLPDFISSWGDRETLFNPPAEWFIPTPDGQFDLRPEQAPDILAERQPSANAFQGPLIVLTGPANASGATMVIAKLRDMKRARLVGTQSGGSAEGPTAGKIFNVGLPNSKIAVRVPVAFNQMAVGEFEKSGGVRPDVEVPETVEDFRKGFDRALDVALTLPDQAPDAH